MMLKHMRKHPQAFMRPALTHEQCYGRTDVRTNGRRCMASTVSILHLRTAHAPAQGYASRPSISAIPPTTLTHRPQPIHNPTETR